MTRVVLDIGGTNTRVACVEDGQLCEVATFATPQLPDDALAALVHAIQEVSKSAPVAQIVGGVPGALDEAGVVLSAPNLPAWENWSLAAALHEATGASVLLKNDADLAGLGEATSGAAKGYRVVAYLGLGTGVGGTRIVAGKIDAHTKRGIETGHQIVDIATGATLESLVGGHALEQKRGSAPATFQRSVWQELTPTLAVGVWNAVVHWSPDIVVLGGSLIRAECGFDVGEVEAEVKHIAFPGAALPAFAPAALGDLSGLHGARVLLESV